MAGLPSPGSRESRYTTSTDATTQRDPIDNALDERGWNRYVYAGNDPINFVDPTGLVSTCTKVAGGLGILSGAVAVAGTVATLTNPVGATALTLSVVGGYLGFWSVGFGIAGVTGHC